MTDLSQANWRKFTDINREYSIFEMVIGDDVILDVGFSDDGVFEISFHQAIVNFVISVEILQKKLDEGRFLAEKDKLD